MNIRAVTANDISSTVKALTNAFSDDPLMSFLFGPAWQAESGVAEFFRILLSARLSLAMPAYCAEDDGGIIGAVMGYDSTRPAWAEIHTQEWKQLMESVEGLESRLEIYSELAGSFEPSDPHAYLGVIGVCGRRKGGGVGRALLERFCQSAIKDENSSGVYLETASEASLRFYLRNGFELRGEGMVGNNTHLWCVFMAFARSAVT